MHRRKQRRTAEAASPAANSPSPHSLLRAVVIPVALAAVAAIALGLLSGNQPQRIRDQAAPAKTPPAPAPADAKPAAKPSPAASSSAPDYAFLQGKWYRGDDKMIDIRQAASDGQLDAAYFNPSPIMVSQAQASQAEGKTQVFVELRDVNYPGCTYTLTYDPARDQLQGVYFQAAVNERYDVTFSRNP